MKSIPTGIKSNTHWAAIAALAFLGGCTTVPPNGSAPRKEIVYAVTTQNKLISFNAGQPGTLLSQKFLTGLQDKETLLAIDFRVAKGMLYGMGSSGRLYRLDTASGAVQLIGTGPIAMSQSGNEFGFDFNPTVDRIRFVSDTGQNMRLHPDTGAVVDSDPNTAGLQVDGKLSYAASDVHAGHAPAIVAAGYTYNKLDEKATTNYAIDGMRGTLVTQGTREGKTPAVSPNTGQLLTVGALGIGKFERASFDISDLANTAFLAAAKPGVSGSSLYEVSLESGKATLIGSIASGDSLVGIAIEP